MWKKGIYRDYGGSRKWKNDTFKLHFHHRPRYGRTDLHQWNRRDKDAGKKPGPIPRGNVFINAENRYA